MGIASAPAALELTMNTSRRTVSLCFQGVNERICLTVARVRVALSYFVVVSLTHKHSHHASVSSG